MEPPATEVPEQPKPPKIAKGANVHIPRQALRQKLLDLLAPGTVQWGAKFGSYQQQHGSPGAGLHVHFEDGTTSGPHSLVVGADGIFSKVRQQLIPDDGPLTYLGCVVVLGITSFKHPMFHQRVFETVDGTTRVYCMPFTPSIVMWQLSFPYPEEAARAMAADPALLKAEALRRCAGWHSPVPEMFLHTELGQMSGGPVYDRPLLSQDSLGPLHSGGVGGVRRVTLLGDAAHPMSPFKGQGANQAIMDGVELAKAIDATLHKHRRKSTGHRVWPSIVGLQLLQEYEPKMMERSAVKVLASRLCAELQHTEGSLVAQGESEEKTQILEELRRRGFGAWDAVDPEANRPEGEKAAALTAEQLMAEVAHFGMHEGPEFTAEVHEQGQRLNKVVSKIVGYNPGGVSSEMHRTVCSWQTSIPDKGQPGPGG